MKTTTITLAMLLALILAITPLFTLAEGTLESPGTPEDTETQETAPASEEAPAEHFFAGMKLTNLDGTPFDTSVFKGKPTLMNFWATWCPPCIAEMPHLNELAEEYKDKINIVGVQVDGLMVTQEGEILVDQDKTEAALKLQADQGLTFPLLNPDETLFILFSVPNYGLQIKVVPTTWLIDGDGYIRGVLESAYDKEQWAGIIDQFLVDLEKPRTEEGDNEG